MDEVARRAARSTTENGSAFVGKRKPTHEPERQSEFTAQESDAFEWYLAHRVSSLDWNPSQAEFASPIESAIYPHANGMRAAVCEMQRLIESSPASKFPINSPEYRASKLVCIPEFCIAELEHEAGIVPGGAVQLSFYGLVVRAAMQNEWLECLKSAQVEQGGGLLQQEKAGTSPLDTGNAIPKVSTTCDKPEPCGSFGLLYDRQSQTLTRTGEKYRLIAWHLSPREHEVLVAIHDAPDNVLSGQDFRQKIPGSDGSRSEAKRTLCEKLAVFDADIPDARTARAYVLTDTSQEERGFIPGRRVN